MIYDFFSANLDDLEKASLSLLDRTISYYRPAKVYALYSGGADSTASTLLAAKHPAFSGVLHLDTETGIQETQDHVARTCETRGWDLLVEKPGTTSYEELVKHMGFPGRPWHNATYNALKDRALKRITGKKRNGGKVLLVAGARTGESQRRMSNAKLLTEKPGDNRVWLNVILHWSKDATRDYAAREGLLPTPVSEKLGMSGECLCGCYARPGERDLIRMHYPEWDEWMTDLEGRVREAGKWHYWGIQAPPRVKTWDSMPGLDGFAQMCTDCERRAG